VSNYVHTRARRQKMATRARGLRLPEEIEKGIERERKLRVLERVEGL
jgi:hypothetical protein